MTRIRSIAEHALTPDANDALNNTRTTVARWWERLLIAPNRVNYHLEHHLIMTVPHYKLPRFHRMLRERGVLKDACVAYGYLGVLKKRRRRCGSYGPNRLLRGARGCGRPRGARLWTGCLHVRVILCTGSKPRYAGRTRALPRTASVSRSG